MTELGTWRELALGEVLTDVQYGLSLAMRDSGQYPILRMAAIQDGKVLLDDLKYVDLPEGVASRYILQRDDVLLNRTNSADLVGKVGTYRGDRGDVVFASYLMRLMFSPKIDHRFIGHLLASYAAQCRLRRYATPGVQQVNINASNVRKVKITIPYCSAEALREQQSIAAILDAADIAIERANEALRQVRRLRQGVVAAEIKKLEGAPTKLGAFMNEVSYGTSQASNDRKRGFPTLRIPNVVGDGLDLTDLTYVDAPPNQTQRYGLADGDLLLVRTNGNPNYIGRSVVFRPPTNEIWFYASYLIRVRLKDSLIPEYVDEYLGTEMGRRELFRRVTTSAGNYNINSRSIQSLPLPVPNESDQKKIVQLAGAWNELVRTAKHRVIVLERIKRGLMQDLLTGKVRVPATLEVAGA